VATFTTVQAAKELGVARDTIYRWMKASQIKGAPVTKLGDLRLRLWTEADLNRVRMWMEKHPHRNRGKKKNERKSKV
jgi:excisionase family DNA binding protein